MTKPSILNWYLKVGYPLTLLQGKAPFLPKWQLVDVDEEDLYNHFVKLDSNLGFRLRSQDLVVDVDPRNGGADSLLRLEADLGISFDDAFTVYTGSEDEAGRRGRHFYFSLPPGYQDGRLRNEDKADYPGIEMKTRGSQVVIAGSMHDKTKNLYRFKASPEEMTIQTAPLALLERYTYVARIPEADEETISPEELKEILADLPVENYSSHDAWFNIFAAAYHSTAGMGVNEFVDWSTKDPSYWNHGDHIRYRWDSLAHYRGPKRSVGTLLMERKKYVSPSIDDIMATFEAADPADLQARVEGLSERSSKEEIDAVLAEVASLDRIQQGRLVPKLAGRLALGKTVVNQAIKEATVKRNKAIREARRAAQSDDEPRKSNGVITTELCELVLDTIGEEHLLHAADQAYWQYNGSFWEPYADNLVEQQVLRAGEAYQDANPDLELDMSQFIGKVMTLLRPTVATGRDLLGAVEGVPPVVNCANVELWVDEMTGHVDPRPHQPSSGLTYGLPIRYNPDAKCPRFDQFLKEIFEPAVDRKDVIRHIWEIIGYTIQPNKNLASWFLFHGKGRNGKTVLLEILGALLGPAVLFHNISAFDTSKNSFALADLVGKLALVDDDVEKGHLLKDDFIKKVAENKTLQANPKFRKPFQFKSCATVFLAANSWPKTRDLTQGMRDRVNVVPFKRYFQAEERDKSLSDYIRRHEMSGVLNGALAGLQRLRSRGGWDVPKTCQVAVAAWEGQANQSRLFLDTHYVTEGGHQEKFRVVWELYKQWCQLEGIKNEYSRSRFEEAISDVGYQVVKSSNVKFVTGIRQISDEVVKAHDEVDNGKNI